MSITVGTVVQQNGATNNVGSTDATVDVGAGSNRGLLVGFFSISSSFPATATFNGFAMTATTPKNDGTVAVGWFYLSNPSSGSHTLAITTQAVINTYGLVAVPVTGAHQTTASLIDAPASSNGSSSPASTTITSGATGDLALDALGIIGDGLTTFTPGGGQTSLSAVINLNNGVGGMAVSSKAGAASVTMSWTNSAISEYVHQLISVNPAASSATLLAANGVAVAAISKMDLISYASIKSANGLTTGN